MTNASVPWEDIFVSQITYTITLPNSAVLDVSLLMLIIVIYWLYFICFFDNI